MAIDAVTGRRNGERPAPASGRGSGAGCGAAGVREAGRRATWDDAGPDDAPVLRRRAVQTGTRRGPAVCAGSHAPDLHGSRLTPRGRLVVALVWLVMAAVAALMLATVPGDGADAPGSTTKVMVEPGETLWRIAGEMSPGADRQETVAAIMSLNGLDSASQIRPGDVLVVPVEL